MPDHDSLLTIGAFARLVGLSSSALRFYDDCGLLRPQEVDATSGYRYYSADQERRASTISRLRGIGLPLQDIRTVLDGPPEQARAALRTYAEHATGIARRARETTEDVIASLPEAADATAPTTVVVRGPELASALRQVSPAAAAVPDIPVLKGVLLQLGADELTVVATDRYWMAVRTLPVEESSGTDRPVVVAADAVAAAIRFAAAHDRLRLRIAEDGVTTLESDDDQVMLLTLDAQFPSYHSVLASLPPTAGRVTVDRVRLSTELLQLTDADAIVLTTGPDHLDLRVDGDRHGVRLTAICTGEELAIAFRPSLLLGALDVSIGPEVLLELPAQPNRPVVVRSADQGTFTTIVMPVRRDSRDD
ncbi:MAG TPA: MerR family transcriptional regulator [Flexivirga sp.]|uniref:DNA polymerase III subunit beta family protein n=1 Tax=Flexivirga sp. TaxID=1962927 RepID=UPI002B5D5BF1|nr:MerR family transcriptional regulator [Flexivirga sp.]HWC22400.1 MerR family transcriptional regulator [Flexivirga sp.]